MKIIFLKRSPTESDGPKNEKHFFAGTKIPIFQMAEGVGFEPTLGLLLSLISSQGFNAIFIAIICALYGVLPLVAIF
jgi:hypothetical protein